MAALSNSDKDIFDWLTNVIESVQTKDQLETTRKLLLLYIERNKKHNKTKNSIKNIIVGINRVVNSTELAKKYFNKEEFLKK